MDSILYFFNNNIAGILILFGVGLVFIVKGGDFFVDAAGWLAEVSGIPKFIIGATVVSFATTLPELLTSAFATVDAVQSPLHEGLELAIGNAVGSVTANIGLIMGISLLCIPSTVNRREFAGQAVLMLGAAALLCVFAAAGSISLAASALLLAVFAVFMFLNLRSAFRTKEEPSVELQGERPTGKVVAVNIAKFIIGAVGIVVGADMLVDYGTLIAQKTGIPENIIGITIVAIGTSLPELVTTITAIVKKQASLSVGNIIGANIFDLTLILPVCSFLSGGRLEVPAKAYAAAWPSALHSGLDMPVCLLVGLIALLPPLFTKRFYRWQGVLLILVYLVYIATVCVLQTA